MRRGTYDNPQPTTRAQTDMKNRTITLIFAALAVMFAVAAPAQQYTKGTLRTAIVAAGATTNLTDSITLTKYEDLSLCLSTLGGASSTGGAITATFGFSVDGSTYETTGSLVVSHTATGATRVNTITNIPIKARGYIRLLSIANACYDDPANYATNTVYYSLKPQRYGK